MQKADVIIIGAGIAGLTVALNSNAKKIHLITKAKLDQGAATQWAQGGLAVAIGKGDSPVLHAMDTMAVSGDLASSEMVDILTQEGPEALKKIVHMGAKFDRDRQGNYALGREAAHSRARIIHTRDATGSELMRVLLSKLSAKKNVSIFENHHALELIIDNNRVKGVVVIDEQGRKVHHFAKAVVLATGGASYLYSHTTNPPQATGDGLALAAQAGVLLADLAFVQFHPTALSIGADPMPLITEAIRGAGARLVNSKAQRIHTEVDLAVNSSAHPELEPRDIVSRIIWRKMQQGDTVYLDARASLVENVEKMFPKVFALCRHHGVDPRTDLIPVAPAAHYHMGGVWVDSCGQSSLPGLWACGEVAATGVHGANRLASNSLLEALVFGHRIAIDIASSISTESVHSPEEIRNIDLPITNGQLNASLLSQQQKKLLDIRQLMWDKVGIERKQSSLEQAESWFSQQLRAKGNDNMLIKNALIVSRLISKAALIRCESRGSHFRCDYPQQDAAWRKRQLSSIDADGGIHSWRADLHLHQTDIALCETR